MPAAVRISFVDDRSHLDQLRDSVPGRAEPHNGSMGLFLWVLGSPKGLWSSLYHAVRRARKAQAAAGFMASRASAAFKMSLSTMDRTSTGGIHAP